MRDLFDLLGLPFNAAASEVRRVCARRVYPVHPDFRMPADDGPVRASRDTRTGDVAVDFMTMATFVDRMESEFFHSPE